MDCEKTKIKKGTKTVDGVKEIQKLLTQYGYYDGKVDGDFGQYTESSVKTFQKALGLTVDGWIGKETCKKLQTLQTLQADMKQGSKGEYVTIIQTKLKQLGLYTASVDGDYGSKTTTAVKEYQKAKGGLLVDGIVGKVTYKSILETSTIPSGSGQKTKLVQRFEKATGYNITDYKSLYNAFKNKVRYVLYYNDIYTLEQEITRVENRLPLNCTDQAQLAMQLLQDIGYKRSQIRIVRGVVTCSNGKAYGHVWLQLNLGNGWFNYDPSAGSAHGHAIGKLICNYGTPKITNIDPAWAVSDDGKT